MNQCPECAGQQMLGHPAGILAYDHTNNCMFRDHEDGRHLADIDAVCGPVLKRPATATERTLLESQGFVLPAELTTWVMPLSRGVHRRVWPQIEVSA